MERKKITRRKRSAPKLTSYNIPKSILKKHFEELSKSKDQNRINLRNKCHQTSYEAFATIESPSALANFMTSLKQATEQRNIKLLYDLITKSLKIKNNFLLQQSFEYLYIAISHDEHIEHKEEILSQFIARVKKINCEPEEYLQKVHGLQIQHIIDDDSSSD